MRCSPWGCSCSPPGQRSCGKDVICDHDLSHMPVVQGFPATLGEGMLAEKGIVHRDASMYSGVTVQAVMSVQDIRPGEE